MGLTSLQNVSSSYDKATKQNLFWKVKNHKQHTANEWNYFPYYATAISCWQCLDIFVGKCDRRTDADAKVVFLNGGLIMSAFSPGATNSLLKRVMKSSGWKCYEQTTEVVHAPLVLTKSTYAFRRRFFASGRSSFADGILWSTISSLGSLEHPITTRLCGIFRQRTLNQKKYLRMEKNENLWY